MRYRALVFRQLFVAVLLCPLVGWPTPSFAGICRCDTRIRDHVPLFDMAVNLTDAEKVGALERHLPWGIPANPAGATNETLIILRNYIINYDADLNTPTWVAYRLTSEDVDENQPGYVKRLDCFRDFPANLSPDDTPPTCDDYEEDSFDQGHLANSNDMCRSRFTNANSFFLVNMAPQFANFNRKIWRTLEGEVHQWAAEKGIIFTITGAVFDHDANGIRDPDATVKKDDGNARIALASHFYKIILHPLKDGSIETISILLPHNNVSIIGDSRFPYLKDHIVTIKKIEALTGIDFLTELEIDDPDKADALRNTLAPDLWSSH